MTYTPDVRHSAAALLRKPSALVALGLILLVVVIWTVTAVRSSRPETLDQRTMDVARQLQCPVCHGESVADAPSPLAQEMCSLIREELSQGMSEQQVVAYFHTRYGDQILESPPVTGFTGLIWLGPVLILLLSAFMLLSLVREWRRQRAALASAPEQPPTSSEDGASVPDRTSADSASPLSPEDRRHYLALLRQELAAEEGYEEGRTR
jgi:cytochrome c-type biogenesis protein CcmH